MAFEKSVRDHPSRLRHPRSRTRDARINGRLLLGFSANTKVDQSTCLNEIRNCFKMQ